jgi:hypothetical protein
MLMQTKIEKNFSTKKLNLLSLKKTSINKAISNNIFIRY